MKPLRKWALRIGAALLVIFILLLISKDAILRVIAERRIRGETGMKVTIGRLSCGLFSPVVTIEDLKLYNTADFGGSPFLDLRELHLELDRAALAAHKIHVTLFRFNLAELDVVRNQAGQTNVIRWLNQVKSSHSEKRGSPRLLKNFEFAGIDVLDLSFGQFKYVDLANAAKDRELNLDLTNQVFRDVKSEADVYGILFMIWLRSGGKFSLGPGALPLEHIRAIGDDSGTADRATVIPPTVPPGKP